MKNIIQTLIFCLLCPFLSFALEGSNEVFVDEGCTPDHNEKRVGKRFEALQKWRIENMKEFDARSDGDLREKECFYYSFEHKQLKLKGRRHPHYLVRICNNQIDIYDYFSNEGKKRAGFIPRLQIRKEGTSYKVVCSERVKKQRWGTSLMRKLARVPSSSGLMMTETVMQSGLTYSGDRRISLSKKRDGAVPFSGWCST